MCSGDGFIGMWCTNNMHTGARRAKYKLGGPAGVCKWGHVPAQPLIVHMVCLSPPIIMGTGHK